jgi:glycosyltransferase involved in cell wall biosynthesis
VHSRVAVIIPTVARHSLSATLESVHNQSFTDFDVIIVDDSVEQQVTSSSFRVIRTGGSQGVSSARNLGVRHVDSEFIALLDDDDEWLPHYLEKQLINFKNLGIDFGLTGANVNGRKRPKTPLQIGTEPFQALYANPHILRSKAYLPTSSYMFRTKVIQKITFDESISDRENLKFIQDCYINGFKIFPKKSFSMCPSKFPRFK